MASTPKKVVVAGATGYLGKHFVRVLKDAGHTVRALARKESGLADVRSLCDEVFIGQATRPNTIRGLCDDADVVFSSIGTRSLRRAPTIWDIDYQANKWVLDEARRAKAGHFIFVAGLHGAKLRDGSPQIEARERVVDDIVANGPEFTIIRPTGFFNDMAEIFRMAQKGSIWLTGNGRTRINPIHGKDLAIQCLRAVEEPELRGQHMDVGGPDIYSFDGAAMLALDKIGRKGKIHHAPAWTVRTVGRAIGKVNTNVGSLLKLLSLMGEEDFVGEPVGDMRLEDFFAHLAGDSSAAAEFLWDR